MVRADKAAKKEVQRKGQQGVVESGEAHASRPVKHMLLGTEDEEQALGQRSAHRCQRDRQESAVPEDPLLQPADAERDQGCAHNHAAEAGMRRGGKGGSQHTRAETQESAAVSVTKHRPEKRHEQGKVRMSSMEAECICENHLK